MTCTNQACSMMCNASSPCNGGCCQGSMCSAGTSAGACCVDGTACGQCTGMARVCSSALAEGCNAVLRKPFPPEDLESVINDLLEGGEPADFDAG